MKLSKRCPKCVDFDNEATRYGLLPERSLSGSAAAVRLGSAPTRLLMALPFWVSRVELSRVEPPEPLKAGPRRRQK